MLIASARPDRAAALAALLARLPWARAIGEGLVVAMSERWQEGPAPLLAVQGDIVCRRSDRLLPQAEIAAALAAGAGDAIAGWAPPFRLAWRDGSGVRIAADAAGLGAWFLWEQDGIAVAADQAAEIGAVFGLSPDLGGLAGIALAGAAVDRDSPVAGVSKLPPGHAALLEAGTIALSPLPAPVRVADGPEAVFGAVRRLLAVHPDAGLELSGGWDSRLMLAASPDELARRFSVTIGDDANGDVPVGRQLAAALGLPHQVISPDVLGSRDADGLWALLADTAARDDFAANPLDRAVINLINAELLPAAGRLSGQNGEILRGFYYPGQPLDRPPSPALAERVVDWRILSNDVVDPSLFDSAWLGDARSALRARLTGLLLAGGEPEWSLALDRFYLEQRMQRWCGTSVSAALGRRPILLPFFDADVIALAAATPSADKAGSRLVARMIAAASPGLAAIPLESGVTPALVARGGPGVALAQGRRFAAKALAKLRQRFTGTDRATFGSASTLAHTLRHGLPARVDIHRLARLGIFDPARLEAFADGRWQPSRSATGFLYMTHFLLERLEQR